MDKENKNMMNDSKKKNARVFLVYFTTMIYIAITTASITDVQLMLNDPVVLPLVNARVNITIFFIISPIILISLFIFYNLHYLHLKTEQSEVKNYLSWPIFEFGKFEFEMQKKGINFIQIGISNLILYASLPITLLVVSFRFSYTHNPILIICQIVLLSVGCIASYYFWKTNSTDYDKKYINRLCVLVSIFLVIVYYLYSYPLNELFNTLILPLKFREIIYLAILFLITLFLGSIFKIIWKIKFWKTILMSFWFYILLSPFAILHYLVNIPEGKGRNVDLSYQIISQNPNSLYRSIYSVDLRNAQLQGANLVASVLIGADLKRANLQYAALTFTKLDSADLSEADLRNAEYLTTQQLCSVKSLYKTKLDSNWIDSVNVNCPQLLEDQNKMTPVKAFF